MRKQGSLAIIDQVTVSLNLSHDIYEANFSNLGLGKIPIADEYPEKYDRLLCGGIWCKIQLEYNTQQEEQSVDVVIDDEDIDNPPIFVRPEKKEDPIIAIRKLIPIQMPNINLDDLKKGRKAFTKEEWIDVMLRSVGMVEAIEKSL